MQALFPPSAAMVFPEDFMLPDISRLLRKSAALAVLLPVFLFAACGAKNIDDPSKYRADREEMMPVYTPRDDGVPLSPNELHAFKTVSDLDRHLTEEDARIVELHFKFFVHQHRAMFERFLDRSARFLPYVRKTFLARGIPADIAYLCMVESGGNPNARSPAGAAGLWQFMPLTGRKFGLTQNSWLDERRDPFKATYAASDYLLKLYSDFADWSLAVAAYNAGEGKIGRALSGTGAKGFFELCRLDDQLDEKSRLREETRDYVPRLIAVAKIMRNLQRLGFSPPSPDKEWNLNPLTVPPGTNLAGLARHLGLSWEEFSGMNPAFHRTASPPAAPSTAYVPPDKLGEAVTWVAGDQARAFTGWKEYTVKKGDSLASIAKRHKVSVAAIREANGFANLPAGGTSILIPGSGAADKIRDAQPARPSSPPAGAGQYTVQPGDTLSGLAKRWGSDVQSIRQANGMSAQDSALKPGRRISVPGNSKNRPAPAVSSRTGASPSASPGASPVASPAAPDRRAASPGASAGASPGASPGASHHVVRAGETVYGIAGSLGVSVQDLCDLNNLERSKPNIRPGMRLLIPGKSGAPAKPAPAPTGAAPGKPASPATASAPDSGREKAPAKGRVVIVKAGDTLSGIAREHKIPLSALKAANRLDENAKLKPGQKLVLP
jgi:membrane-bound lytic murein transglycosylase D